MRRPGPRQVRRWRSNPVLEGRAAKTQGNALGMTKPGRGAPERQTPLFARMSKTIEEILVPKPAARPRIYAYAIAEQPPLPACGHPLLHSEWRRGLGRGGAPVSPLPAHASQREGRKKDRDHEEDHRRNPRAEAGGASAHLRLRDCRATSSPGLRPPSPPFGMEERVGERRRFTFRQPLSLTLSPLLRRGERESNGARRGLR